LPQRQYRVSIAGRRYRLDFAWPELRVGLECDGWEHHGRRSAFAPDRARLAEFAAAKWRVLPVTWHAVTREPARVERWLRDALSSVPDSLVS
jgi:very-short-patch-repair endonuclease